MSGHHILVVDDDAGFRLMLETLLTRQGHRTVAAHSSDAALAAIQDEVPRLVLCDLELGHRRSGAEVVDYCRAQEPPIDVIVITGHSAANAFGILGTNDVPLLRKPFDIAALNASIQPYVGAMEIENRPHL